MGVHCKVKLKGGFYFNIDYICFGFLRVLGDKLHNSDIMENTNNYRRTVDGKILEMSTSDFDDIWDRIDPSDIIHVDFYPMKSSYIQSPMWSNQDAYLEEMRLLLKGLPMFNGCLKVMPRKKVIRATFKNNPCDKIILGLILSRNMSQLRTNSAYAYARGLGHSRNVSLVFHSNFCKSKHSRWHHDSELQNITYFYQKISYEDSILEISTTGTKDMTLFLNQGVSYNPWYQENFHNSDNGYTRDYDYGDMGEIFNKYSISYELDEWGDPIYSEEDEDEAELTCNTYYRRMTFCFSPNFKEDKPIPGITTLNEYKEFEFIHRRDAGSNFNEDDAKKILDALEVLVIKGE